MPAVALPQRRLANAIRALAMDAVQKANSGHPGAPMGMADIAEVLWRGVLKHNPKIHNGLTVTVLCCLMVMGLCCNMRYCI
jgi:transketolase N-terminal domain/subunit